jgi:hypothetical protein
MIRTVTEELDISGDAGGYSNKLVNNQSLYILYYLSEYQRLLSRTARYHDSFLASHLRIMRDGKDDLYTNSNAEK